jgi:hypothetical protein
MSQYPVGYDPQYSFWPYYQATPQQLLAPAKWAGVLMIVLGVIVLLIATCSGASSYIASDKELLEQLEQFPKQEQAVTFSPTTMRTINLVMVGIMGVYGIGLMVLGAWVRSGRLLPVILSLASIVLPLLFMMCMFLASFTLGAAGVIAFVVIAFFPLVLMIACLVFLIRAAGNTSKIAQSQQQMTAMYQQQMQQYYAHQQPGDSQPGA